MVVGLCFVLMFLFVPETFWDRTPHPHAKSRFASISNIFHQNQHERKSNVDIGGDASSDTKKLAVGNSAIAAGSGQPTIAQRRKETNLHVGFADQTQSNANQNKSTIFGAGPEAESSNEKYELHLESTKAQDPSLPQSQQSHLESQTHSSQDFPEPLSPAIHACAARIVSRDEGPQTLGLHNFNSPNYVTNEEQGVDYVRNDHETLEATPATTASVRTEPETATPSVHPPVAGALQYTNYLRTQPPKTYSQTLKPWNGRLRHENWLLVAIRPFILFAYPSILWSTLVYSLSIGWLIVLSESVTTIYKNKATYNFTSLQTGLVYISPFVGGILGTVVAGKVSDIIVRYMSRRNGGVYEPEFRLVMAIPITISTCIGLMGFGWSAQERDNWIIPTVFFGLISFGCSLGSTTSITFAVDSYRQYAGEALVTLNFSKSN